MQYQGDLCVLAYQLVDHMSRHTANVVSERKQVNLRDVLGWVHIDKPWSTQETQSSDAKHSMEDINHITWPVCDTAFFGVLRWSASFQELVTRYLLGS